jgi:hypothetical protein
MPSFVFQGSSRKDYTYLLFPIPFDVTRMPRQPANYILAGGSSTNPRPIWIECANGLQEALKRLMVSEHWITATDIYGATFLYANFDSAEDANGRLAQKIDLIDRYAPPMNRE